MYEWGERRLSNLQLEMRVYIRIVNFDTSKNLVVMFPH